MDSPILMNVSQGKADNRHQIVSISREVLLYLGIVILGVVLRIAQLDVVPLDVREARQALAAWRVVYPQAAGDAIVPESSLLFALHSFFFSSLGASEFTTRIGTVIGSLLLVISPLLFSRLLGRGRAFVFSILLFCSPVTLAASRSDSPVIWLLLLVVIGLWGLWRYRETRQRSYAFVTMISLSSAGLLTDSIGVFFLLALALATAFTYWSRDPMIDDAPENEQSNRVGWPWGYGIGLSTLVIVLVSTLFTLYPAGLSNIGENLITGLRGLTEPRPYTPIFFPILVTFFYEPILVIVGLIAIFRLFRSDSISTEDRFLVGWLIFAIVLNLIYAGSGPEHALLLVFPLSGLASNLIIRLLTVEGRRYTPVWSRWVIAIVVIGVLFALTIHGQAVARSMITSQSSVFQLVSVSAYNVVWLIIAVLFTVICYFIASTEWDEDIALRGGGLGVVAFALVTGIGSGWHIAVQNAGNPVEFWNRNPTSNQTLQLRSTLFDLVDRETSGFPELEVIVLAPDDGVVAWSLREFPNTQFITDFRSAQNQPILLLPMGSEKFDLGGPYVGQQFVISRGWGFQNINPASLPAWWMQRRTLTGGVPVDSMILWLRQDIYDGVKGQ